MTILSASEMECLANLKESMPVNHSQNISDSLSYFDGCWGCSGGCTGCRGSCTSTCADSD